MVHIWLQCLSFWFNSPSDVPAPTFSHSFPVNSLFLRNANKSVPSLVWHRLRMTWQGMTLPHPSEAKEDIHLKQKKKTAEEIGVATLIRNGKPVEGME